MLWAVPTTLQRTPAAGNDVLSNGQSGQVPEPLFDQRYYSQARQLHPRLYWQITQDHVSFDHVAKAWHIRNDPANPVGDEETEASLALEYLAKRRFSKDHEGILRDYFKKEPWAGCALTGDGWVHSAMNITDSELVLYEDRVHQLCRDAHRTFEAAAQRSKTRQRDRHPVAWLFRSNAEKAKRDLAEVGEMLYVVLARVILAASVIDNKNSSERQRDEALDAVRIEWKNVQASVTGMIQRQARFEYFEGVGLGALITIPALAIAGWAAMRYGVREFSEPGEPGSLTAAIIGGAVGAVISVTQRMTANTHLDLDFTAPKQQKIVLGALRPIVGAMFGAVVYFGIVGGLLAVQARTSKDASIALAFFAVAGFAAGFSERFATDVLDRASRGILPATRYTQDFGKPDDPSLLLSGQRRHAATPTAAREPNDASTSPERNQRSPD